MRLRRLDKREDGLRQRWDACEGHAWERSEAVIDTNPSLDTFFCRKCGAATHDPRTGDYCFRKHFDL